MAAVEKLAASPAHFADSVLELPLRCLIPAEDNPRRQLGDVGELAMSIKSVGLIEPIVATPRDMAAGTYTVVAGHRRLAAAELAGLDYVPVYVKELDDQERIAAMLVENLQRTDLQPLEEAAAFRRLVDEFGLTQRQLSEKIGRSQGHISKRLALLQLPEQVQAQVDAGGITIADAVELAKLAGEPERIERVLNRGEWRSIESAVELELERKKRDDEVAKLLAVAEGEGLRVVAAASDEYGHNLKLPKGTFRLERSPQYGNDVLGLDPKKHESEECHAIAIHPRTKERIPVCTNRKNHPNAKTPEERHQAQMRSQGRTRPQVTEQTDALDKAETARRAFVRELLQRKSAIAKNELLEIVLRGVIDMGIYGDGADYALEVLGLIEPSDDRGPRKTPDGKTVTGTMSEQLLRDYAAKGERELQRAALAIVLGEADANGCSSWSRTWDNMGAYFGLLMRHGYELAKIERDRLGKQAPKAAS